MRGLRFALPCALLLVGICGRGRETQSGFPALSVDAQGVLRDECGRETNLFGVNYYACFAYWSSALDRAGKDPFETMRMDVAHFRRLGLDCLRIHCFDRQISDARGISSIRADISRSSTT